MWLSRQMPMFQCPFCGGGFNKDPPVCPHCRRPLIEMTDKGQRHLRVPPKWNKDNYYLSQMVHNSNILKRVDPMMRGRITQAIPKVKPLEGRYASKWCNKCGLCCEYLKVNLTEEDIKVITSHFSPKGKKKFDRYLESKDGEHWIDFPCPFLRRDQENKCSCWITTFRPHECFVFSQKDCLKTKKMFG